jgi:hypothetical protein
MMLNSNSKLLSVDCMQVRLSFYIMKENKSALGCHMSRGLSEKMIQVLEMQQDEKAKPNIIAKVQIPTICQVYMLSSCPCRSQV